MRDECPPDHIFSDVILKLVARCNINCTYCYWFRDRSVYELPKLLSEDIEDKFIERLAAHLTAYKMPSFTVSFHGGEPLLFGQARMRNLCRKLLSLAKDTGVQILPAITTNGTLVDREWVKLFKEFDMAVALSLDGAEEEHNLSRVDFNGRGTYQEAVCALKLLQDAGLDPEILAVCNPQGDPDMLYTELVDTLGVRMFNVLIPDATFDDEITSIENYYVKLFDLWFDRYSHMGVEVRIIEDMLRGILGGQAASDGIGYGPVTALTMLTDGSLEPLDVLRIAGHGFTKTSYNVRDHQLQDLQNDGRWREARDASLNLCATCKACEFHDACGGGHPASRWSKDRGYDNPSVYCRDLKGILRHIRRRVGPTLFAQPCNGQNSSPKVQ